jgi:hypothetical protein
MVAIEPKQGIAFVLCQQNFAKAQCHSIQIIGGTEALN